MPHRAGGGAGAGASGRERRSAVGACSFGGTARAIGRKSFSTGLVQRRPATLLIGLRHSGIRPPPIRIVVVHSETASIGRLHCLEPPLDAASSSLVLIAQHVVSFNSRLIHSKLSPALLDPLPVVVSGLHAYSAAELPAKGNSSVARGAERARTFFFAFRA